MKILPLLALLLLPAAAPARDNAPPGLTVRILDLVPSKGEVVVALFDSAQAFAERSPALRSATLPADGETQEWRLPGLEPGDYAAVAYQDLNGNRDLDKGKLGIPKEPYGFSNDARAAFGPPSFDEALFSWDGESGTIEIRLKRRR